MKVSCEDGCIHYHGSGYCKLSTVMLHTTWRECNGFKKEMPKAIKATESPSEAEAVAGLKETTP